ETTHHRCPRLAIAQRRLLLWINSHPYRPSHGLHGSGALSERRPLALPSIDQPSTRRYHVAISTGIKTKKLSASLIPSLPRPWTANPSIKQAGKAEIIKHLATKPGS